MNEKDEPPDAIDSGYKRISKRRIKQDYTDKELLDMVNIEVIQDYIRKKKLKRIHKVTKKS